MGGQEHNGPGRDGEIRYRSVKLPGEEEKVWFVLKGVCEFEVTFRSIRIQDFPFSKVSCFSKGRGAEYISWILLSACSVSGCSRRR